MRLVLQAPHLEQVGQFVSTKLLNEQFNFFGGYSHAFKLRYFLRVGSAACNNNHADDLQVQLTMFFFQRSLSHKKFKIEFSFFLLVHKQPHSFA